MYSLLETVRDVEVEVTELVACGQDVLPFDTIAAAISDTGTQERRHRKLPTVVMIWVVLTMNLWSESALHIVLQRLVGVLCWHQEGTLKRVAGKSAISQRRRALGFAVFERLFATVCQPLATPTRPGAFYKGWRVMAIDGTTESIMDSAANRLYFGKAHNQYGEAAYPSVRCCYLSECGTHVIIGAGFAPIGVSETRLVPDVLTHLSPDMLLTADAGMYSYDLVAQVMQQSAQLLIRLPSSLKARRPQCLADGSHLVTIKPTNRSKRQHEGPLQVRIISYRITDPVRTSTPDKVYRLLTTLLDAKQFPALELVTLYHERWEIELVIDELDNHQRTPHRPLRSQTPAGVLQELYGLLIMHYIIRFHMFQAATRHNLDPDRISFTHTVALLSHFAPVFQVLPDSFHPALWDTIYALLAQRPLPKRNHRVNPRVVKRTRLSAKPRKRARHLDLPTRAKPFADAVLLLN